MMSTRTPTVQGNGLISPVVIGKKARFLGQKIENSWFSPKNTGDLESISLDCPKTRFQRAIFFLKKSKFGIFPYIHTILPYLQTRHFEKELRPFEKAFVSRNRRNSACYYASCAPFDVGFLYRSAIESTVNNLQRIVEHLIK